MIQKLRAFVKAQEIDARDVHCYGGIVLVGIGGALVDPAAGLVAAGLALFYLSIRRAG